MHKYGLILFLILYPAIVGAQNYSDKDEVLESQASRTLSEQLTIVQQESNAVSSRASLNLFTQNSVLIDQVGFNNKTSINVASNDSRINLLQIGDNNEALITLNSETIRENVLQIGNDNLFVDFSLSRAAFHQSDIIQNGNYNEIISVGKNSLSQKIQITQNGTGRSAYVIHN